MRKRVLVAAVAAYADHLTGRRADRGEVLDLGPDCRAEIAPLLRISDRLKAGLRPVAPSPGFKAQLRGALMAEATRRAEERAAGKKASWLQRRGVVIGAVVGSVLSVAGIIAAIVWRQRYVARLSTPSR